MHTLTHFLYACMHIIRCTVHNQKVTTLLQDDNVVTFWLCKASQFPGKGQCLYKRLFVHASVSVTLYISYLMLKERTTQVCIVQVSHAHPPLAAAVFNCYQMYSKASHK